MDSKLDRKAIFPFTSARIVLMFLNEADMKTFRHILIVLTVLLTLLIWQGMRSNAMNQEKNRTEGMDRAQDFEKATFAGGCFWCLELDFEKLDGVIEAVSGYAGGHRENPTYEDVSSGTTGHAEAVQVTYDGSKVSYEQLLGHFWRHIDPTDPGGQFVDRGSQYRPAIFYHDEEQKKLAEESKKKLEESGRFQKPIVTEIVKLEKFHEAEDYHQDYYKTHAYRYKFYRWNSGRDQFLGRIWEKHETPNPGGRTREAHEKPDRESLKARLTPLQYKVTQLEGTEPPFKNEYWDNKKEGIYVDIVSGEPLFSSKDKYDSGTGWPSFTKPLVPENIVEREDRRLFTVRTEVRSSVGDSHLGHVFNDGPQPKGLRYCLNSAALRFIPVEDLEKEGYVEFLKLFEEKQD